MEEKDVLEVEGAERSGDLPAMTTETILESVHSAINELNTFMGENLVTGTIFIQTTAEGCSVRFAGQHRPAHLAEIAQNMMLLAMEQGYKPTLPQDPEPVRKKKQTRNPQAVHPPYLYYYGAPAEA